MDSDSWWWRNERRLRWWGAVLGVVGLVVFTGCFIALVSAPFSEGRWWFFALSCASYVLMGVGWGVLSDYAREDGYAAGFKDGASGRPWPAGSVVRRALQAERESREQSPQSARPRPE